MINERGYWMEKDSHEHKYDSPLNNELVKILKETNCESIIDLGCGPGLYSKVFVNENFDCQCYDGNPYTPEESDGLCSVLDLSEPFDLNKKYDCVLSLEVGEHIPKQYETIFIDNLLNHSNKAIILSWATIGQGGHGHVNEQPNNYIENLFTPHGYIRNLEYEKRLRDSAHWWWFKNTIMFFEKK
jgi:cyclopropane fatty-acyl-phospholipid synthase-like methyltransferase